MGKHVLSMLKSPKYCTVRVIQIGRERGKVIVKWLSPVKIYGRRPMELLKTINLNKDANNRGTVLLHAQKLVET